MRRVIWSESARNDLRYIDHYLREFDARTAARAMRLISGKLQLLQNYPYLGPELDSESRSLIVRGTTYVIVYAVLDKELAVLRLRDAREDWRLE